MSRRVLGIDPGLTRCGVGVVDIAAGRKLSLISVDTLRTPSDMELAERIATLADGLTRLIESVKPDVIALERLFAQPRLKTVMGTAQISGVVLLLAQQRGIPVVLHTPTEVKAAVTGSGKAAKAQVGTMVAKLLGLAEIPKPADAADSLAIAICQALKGSGLGSASAGKSNQDGATKAQQQWAAAERAAKTSRSR
jgi:crossover junction endodeoxyribonuclease RuvC